MEERSQTSIFEESAIVERVARIVSSVRGIRPDYTRLAAELEQAISFDIFGIVLLRHDRLAVRVVVCRREGGAGRRCNINCHAKSQCWRGYCKSQKWW